MNLHRNGPVDVIYKNRRNYYLAFTCMYIEIYFICCEVGEYTVFKPFMTQETHIYLNTTRNYIKCLIMITTFTYAVVKVVVNVVFVLILKRTLQSSIK